METEFGRPSDKIFVGEHNGKKVAFLPRHGREHKFPPHKIPYKANIAAFKKLGVKQIIAPCASGSLQPDIKPGDFVVCGHFINFTHGRDDTFFHGQPPLTPPIPNKLGQGENESLITPPIPNKLGQGENESPITPPIPNKLGQGENESPITPPVSQSEIGGGRGGKVVHISSAEPYCSYLGDLIFQSCKKADVPTHKDKTVVVVNGPRFSTKAESRFFTNQGFDVINMTQYPEVTLAREAEICYASVALITDYDVGLEGNSDIKSVTLDEVLKVFKENNEKIKKVLFDVIENVDIAHCCSCQKALEGAVVS